MKNIGFKNAVFILRSSVIDEELNASLFLCT